MIKADLYNNKAEKKGDINLPEGLFDLPWNSDLVHQVVVSMQANARVNVAHTKTRGEVSGGGKKPWRQKGTGRARHGSIRSPLWKGGGVTFGPRNTTDFSKKINTKMKNRALFTVLSKKLDDGEVLFIDDLGVTEPKTKEAKDMLLNFAKKLDKKEMAYDKGRRVLIITPEKNDAVIKSFRNIPVAHVEEMRNINTLLVSAYKYVIFLNPDDGMKTLITRVNFSKLKKAEETKSAKAKSPAAKKSDGAKEKVSV